MPTQIECSRQPITPDIRYGLPQWREGCRFFVFANHTNSPELEWYLVSQHRNNYRAFAFAKKVLREVGRSRWLIIIDADTLEIITEIPTP